MRKKKLTCQLEINTTFKEGFEEYLNDCKQRNLRENTLRHYRESYKSITRILDENMPIADMNKNTVGEFIVECKENYDIGDQTLYTYARDLKTLMYFFMRMEYIPTFRIKLPKVDKKAIEPYTDYELKKLLKRPNTKHCRFGEYRNWVLINFVLSTGVRLNSFINIKIKDIDFDNEVVIVNVTKNRKPLILPLNNIIIKILKTYLKFRQAESDEDYLFCNEYGNQLTRGAITISLSNYNKKRGVVKTGIHRFRHTFAKKWILNGGSVVTLQKILGHSNLQITENYINLLVEDLKNDMNQYNILEEFKSNYIKMK
ncbi:tyrosine-type recombinase/integrase [Clostridium perfringens]|nr:tyrosine-type recombinase/integrase [Clostridium perfringens]